MAEVLGTIAGLLVVAAAVGVLGHHRELTAAGRAGWDRFWEVRSELDACAAAIRHGASAR